MSVLSVPLPPDLLLSLEQLVKQGVADTKAQAARKAIKMYLEDQAVKAVLKAAQEPSLKGDLDGLAKKL